MVPLVVPFTITDAPMIGSPVASFTTPLQVSSCSVVLTSSTEDAEAVPVDKPNKSSMEQIVLKCFSIRIKLRLNNVCFLRQNFIFVNN